MITVGSYVRLSPPEGTVGTNGVSLRMWQEIFRRNGGKCKVTAITDLRSYHIFDRRGDGMTDLWCINISWVKPAELTINKLGNFPKKGEVEL